MTLPAAIILIILAHLLNLCRVLLIDWIHWRKVRDPCLFAGK